MSVKSIEQKIITLYHDADNFILLLRTKKVFDDEKYNEILRLYEKYISELSDDDYVNRHVARFLLDIVFFIEGEKYQLELANDNLATKVGHAHAKMLDLLFQLLL